MEVLALLEVDDEEGMWTRWLGIGGVGAGHAHTLPQLDDLHETLYVGDLLLREAHNVDVTLGILSGRELGLVIEQVEQLATINLIKTNCQVECLELRLMMGDNNYCVPNPGDWICRNWPTSRDQGCQPPHLRSWCASYRTPFDRTQNMSPWLDWKLPQWSASLLSSRVVRWWWFGRTPSRSWNYAPPRTSSDPPST